MTEETGKPSDWHAVPSPSQSRFAEGFKAACERDDRARLEHGVGLPRRIRLEIAEDELRAARERIADLEAALAAATTKG